MPRTTIEPALQFGDADLAEFVLDQMRDADPFGDFRVVHELPGAADLALHIGSPAGTLSMKNVFIDASDWLGSISTDHWIGLPASDGQNRLGAIAAACLGVAQLFKIAIGMPSANHIRDGVFDLFHLGWSEDSAPSPWPESLHVGKVLMVGGGSVGSSAAYSMRLAGLSGVASVVDQDVVKVENFNRSPIFGRKTFRHAKSEAVAGFVNSGAFSVEAIPLWWNEFLKARTRLSFEFDVWLPLANEFGVRLAMQSNIPPLMIHASTTANWGVNHGRHVPGRDDCLMDRFPEQATSELTCSTATIQTDGASIDAALPFASLFAGLMVAADLVRAQLPGYPQIPNFALIDWYGSMDTIHAWDKKPRAGCLCRDQDVGFHDRFNAGTRYRNLCGFA
jgi:hypothetical protein